MKEEKEEQEVPGNDLSRTEATLNRMESLV